MRFCVDFILVLAVNWRKVLQAEKHSKNAKGKFDPLPLYGFAKNAF